MSALLMSLFSRLQRGEEGQGCSWRDMAAGAEQGARNLLQRRQRRVDLERLREHRGARGPRAAQRCCLCGYCAGRAGVGTLHSLSDWRFKTFYGDPPACLRLPAQPAPLALCCLRILTSLVRADDRLLVALLVGALLASENRFEICL